jgi:hypothetical protein
MAIQIRFISANQPLYIKTARDKERHSKTTKC